MNQEVTEADLTPEKPSDAPLPSEEMEAGDDDMFPPEIFEGEE